MAAAAMIAAKLAVAWPTTAVAIRAAAIAAVVVVVLVVVTLQRQTPTAKLLRFHPRRLPIQLLGLPNLAR